MKKEKIILIIISFLVALIFIKNALSQTVPASLEVPNVSPLLTAPIPNIISPMNTNRTDILDLDDYFYDENEDLLTFNVTSADNISVTIDPITHKISLFPQFDFAGIRTVYFAASDGIDYALSNEVQISIVQDNESPKWFNPNKSLDVVYQNSYVSFTTTWTDNLALNNFTFYIDQGSGYISYPGNITGQLNYSEVRVQISAAPNSVIHWKINATDLAGNSNETDVQTFAVFLPNITYPLTPTSPPTSTRRNVLGELMTILIPPSVLEEDFVVEPEKILLELKQGETATRFVKITNYGPPNTLMLELLRKDNLTSILTKEYFLETSQSKTIPIEFFTNYTTPANYYENQLIVRLGTLRKSVFIGIIVKELEIGFNVNVHILGNKIFYTGETVTGNITLTNTKDVVDKKIKLSWSMRNWQGEIYEIDSEEVNLLDKLNFEKTIKVPSGTKRGEYLFYVKAEHNRTMDHSADIFQVEEEISIVRFVIKNYLFLIIIILLATTLIALSKYSKNKEKSRILSLYVLIKEMSELIKQEHYEEALLIYLKIKIMYHEKIDESLLQNKELLKEEMMEFADIVKPAKQDIEINPKEEKEKTHPIQLESAKTDGKEQNDIVQNKKIKKEGKNEKKK